MIPNIGPMELILIFGIVMIIFGAKRLPELGKSFGKGIREFQGAMKEITDVKKDVEELGVKGK